MIARAHDALDGYGVTGLLPSVGPNRMSYFLDLHGPSEPVETACSSSLVAVHRAMQVLASDSCELAIAGGVNTLLTPDGHISLSRAGMLSVDGRCKTFSRHANGYVRGEGVGMLVLKKLHGGGTGRRPHLRRDPRQRGEPRRARAIADGAESEGAGGAVEGGLQPCRNRSADGRLYRGAWHRDGARRSDRDQRAEERVPGFSNERSIAAAARHIAASAR